MSEKKGWSEEKTDFWGNKYTQEFREDGTKAGWSEEKTDFWGNKYTQKYGDDGSKAGWSADREGVFGNRYRQDYDEREKKAGSSEEREGLFGNKYRQGYDEQGNESWWSEKLHGVFGNKYTQYYDRSRGARHEPGGRADVGESSAYGSRAISSGTGWFVILLLGGFVFALCIVEFGVRSKGGRVSANIRGAGGERAPVDHGDPKEANSVRCSANPFVPECRLSTPEVKPIPRKLVQAAPNAEVSRRCLSDPFAPDCGTSTPEITRTFRAAR